MHGRGEGDEHGRGGQGHGCQHGRGGQGHGCQHRRGSQGRDDELARHGRRGQGRHHHHRRRQGHQHPQAWQGLLEDTAAKLLSVSVPEVSDPII
ncbi:Late embryogenesis abundant protein, group 3 [Zea mays]|uniref:Late embryogenesis abundant protein, group 3 n=1 Tax=Zea mays TaxID=4577 RepID=A0A1D6NEH7_MAIZE|nr:Late embryogenesis abundant protein, group 3 [Zea mays]